MFLRRKPFIYMALYTWLSSTSGDCLRSLFEPAFRELGLKILQEASGDHQIYAEDSFVQGVPHSSRVNVLVSWTSAEKCQFQIEVRSSEAMLKRGTRCEIVAAALRNFVAAN